jgi:hypothetical protein
MEDLTLQPSRMRELLSLSTQHQELLSSYEVRVLQFAASDSNYQRDWIEFDFQIRDVDRALNLPKHDAQKLPC